MTHDATATTATTNANVTRAASALATVSDLVRIGHVPWGRRHLPGHLDRSLGPGDLDQQPAAQGPQAASSDPRQQPPQGRRRRIVDDEQGPCQVGRRPGRLGGAELDGVLRAEDPIGGTTPARTRVSGSYARQRKALPNISG